MNFPETAVLIPAYNPDEHLLTLADSLIRAGFRAIYIVNDGSVPNSRPLFSRLAEKERTVLLFHAVNSGKGAALKLGMDTIFSDAPEIRTVITADADGQHSEQDIVRLAEEAGKKPDSLFLGVRVMDGSDVPFRSRVGNRISRMLIRRFLGITLTDTQTGLRAIPRFLIPDLLAIAANRYEFELEMLVISRAKRIRLREIPIKTIYLNGNSSSHFNPFLDSWRICVVLFRLRKEFVFRNGDGFPEPRTTDWNRYYNAPCGTAGYARKIVTARLHRAIAASPLPSHPEIAELGGGNSCFSDSLNQAFLPGRYVVFDNNATGLRKFRERTIGLSVMENRFVDLLALKSESGEQFDLVFSVGLIEHFSPVKTARLVQTHFALTRPGGIVILFFPTPTVLYRLTRFFAEVLHLWIFYDERPLDFHEVEQYIIPYGTILRKEIIRSNFLTQQIIVAKKENHGTNRTVDL